MSKIPDSIKSGIFHGSVFGLIVWVLVEMILR